MIIRIFVFAVLLILMFPIYPSSVMAHTGLQSSIPAEGEVVNEQLREIIMEFNTKVESLSSFKLKDALGNEVEIDDMVVNDNIMSGKVAGGMAEGEYTVEWKIVGRDGHPIEGKIRFAVETYAGNTGAGKREEEQSSVPEQIEIPTELDKVEPIDPPLEDASPTNDDPSPGKSPGTEIGIWLIAAIATAALVFIAAGSRRKKK